MFERLHPFSVLAGCALALVALVAMGQKPVAEKWEYRIETDVNEKGLEKLASDGWTFDGYLGASMKGVGNDETLWKRAKK